MNKLQLYIRMSLNGFKSVMDINPVDEICQQVTDISVALEDINYDPREKNIFYLLKSTDKGTFIVLIRTIPSNPTDHLASWIFVPSDLNIRDHDVEYVVETVRDIISKSKISQREQEDLRNLFGKDYDVVQNAGATVENYGKKYAHRYFGGDTGYILSDYIGNKRYQTSYLQYAGVILADKHTVQSITGPDLTDEPLDQMVKILPPLPDDRPYRPLIFDRPFTKPFLVPLMGTVEIVWESSSAVDIRQSIMINKPNMRPDNISLASTRPTAGRINGTSTRTETTSTSTSIDKEPENETPANTPSEKPADRPMNKINTSETGAGKTASVDREHVYNFEIPAKSASISGMIRFEIRTRSTLDSSPIDGYELSDAMQEGQSRSNHLIYAPTEGFQKKAIWGAAGFLIGILISILCTCAFGGSSSAEKAEGETTDTIDTINTTTIYTTPSEMDAAEAQAKVAEKPAPKPEEKPKTEEKGDLKAAIKYLDNNQKWTKEKLESFPELKGLYDDMNNVRRERLVDYWGPKLEGSKNFKKIVKHSSQGLQKKHKPNIKGSTFNTGDDQTIRVQQYLFAVDP